MPHYDVTTGRRPQQTVSRSSLLGFAVAAGVAYAFIAEAVAGPTVASVGFGLVSTLVAVRIAVRHLPAWWRDRRAAHGLTRRSR